MSDLVIAKAWKVGDVVYPNPEAGWAPDAVRTKCKITKAPKGAKQVNYQAMPVDDEGNEIPGARGFKGRPYAFTDVAPTTARQALSTEISRPVNPPIGSIVRPSPTSRCPEGIYVVIGVTDFERVRIQRFGGDNGRYFRAHSKTLTVLDPTAAEKAIMDAGL